MQLKRIDLEQTVESINRIRFHFHRNEIIGYMYTIEILIYRIFHYFT